MDFSALSPAQAPTQLASTTVIVGEKIEANPQAMLDRFSRAFERASHPAHTGSAPQDEAALVVTTSGSTGKPKQTVLSAEALRSSGEATADFTDSHGAQWLLALPLHYVAGAQVIARSALAGTRPAITNSVAHHQSFTPEDFLETADKLSSPKTMLSLVPTQLHQLLEAADKLPETVSALQSFTAILLGGAPASKELLRTAEELKIKTVTTYGSAETAGGCVYNSQPLNTVAVKIQDPDSQGIGRIWLGGTPLAQGYLNDSERTAASFFTDPAGTRWYRTDDRGSFSGGVLTVEGRADDVLITGGIKVSARKIVERLEEHPAVKEAIVTGVPHPRWGQAVAAMITLKKGRTAPATEELAEHVSLALGRPAAPKVIEQVGQLPALSTGKPDRLAIAEILARKLREKEGGLN